LSSIQANTLSVYYYAVDKLNFDESVDTVPVSSSDMVKETPIQYAAKKESKPVESQEKMEIDETNTVQ